MTFGLRKEGVAIQLKSPGTAKVKIGLLQMACAEQPQVNLEKAEHAIICASKLGVQIICLQELFRSQYFCQKEDTELFNLAESISGSTTKAFSALAQEYEMVIIAPIFERRTAGIYHNTAVVLDADGTLLGSYRKMHIPDDPLYYEKFYFTPGDQGYPTFDTRYGRIGVLICWDQWYPEAARLMALAGAKILYFILLLLVGTPQKKNQNGLSQLEAWITIQRSHAIANGFFVASVNRVGHEGPSLDAGLEFWGSSFVCDPFGIVLREASRDNGELLIAECDLSRVEKVRREWPFLRDRRIDSYDQIMRRFLDDSASNL